MTGGEWSYSPSARAQARAVAQQRLPSCAHARHADRRVPKLQLPCNCPPILAVLLVPLLAVVRLPPLLLLHTTVADHMGIVVDFLFLFRALSFSSSGFPPFSWPAVLSFLLASRCAARRARPHARTKLLAALSFYLLRIARIAPRATPARMHARSLVLTPTTDGRTTRRAVRRRG